MKNLKRTMVTLPVLALTLSLGFWSSATAQSFPEEISLPNGFQPEGITLGNGHTAYVGSLAGGSIIEIDLRTGAYSELVPGALDGPGIPGLPRQFAVGLDFDPRSGYLFVAGGLYGDGRVYDTETGSLVDQYYFDPFDPWNPLNAGWINDVVVTRDAAYFTNSFVGEIYKVSLDSQGAPLGVMDTLVLSDPWKDYSNPLAQNPLQKLINANGIVATPNDRTLIVVNYFSGLLYKVDTGTGFVTEIDLGEALVCAGDGLVLKGKTLYVVQNFLPGICEGNQIAVFRLSPDYSAATLTHYLDADDPFVPSTADAFGPWLYAVNARFDVCFPGPCPSVEFEIVRVGQ